MHGLWFEDQRLSYREDLPRPEPGPDEALLRVLTAGICRTDLELLRGYQDFRGIPGHELVAVVEQGPDELLGARVVSEINIGCGLCPSCRKGLAGHCSHRQALGIRGRNGACTQWCTVPVANLHVVPGQITNDEAVHVEPLAAALRIQEQVPVGAEDRVLVVGDGKVGQLVARSLALTGCQLLVVGHHQHKLAMLAALGIATCHSAVPDAASFDVAVECTGNPDGFASAQHALRPRGTLVLKSTYAGRLTCDAAALVVNEISVIGSRCGPFKLALELLAAGRIDLTGLIDHHYPLADGEQAFAAAAAAGAGKIVLDVAAK